MRAIPCALSLLSLLYLVGCGGSSSRSNPGCLGNSTACSGTCVDLQTDSANCGACGSACASGTGCSGGKCSLACATGEYACGGRCTDPASDPSYCGAAADCSGGVICGTGRACYQGMCAAVGTTAPQCQGNSTICSGTCADLQTDNANCGTCGNACATGAGYACRQGACVAIGYSSACQGNSTICSGTCVDLQTDNANCGTCGNACAAGTGCSAGTCSLTCGMGQHACGGTCIDPASSPAYCGAAADCSGGAACGTGYACYQGSCASVCAWTQVASYSLTTAPASAIVRTGGIGGQAAATVGGRTAWYQTSDWNVLLIPTGLASSDDTFAVDADIYVPSYTGSGWVAASIALFTTSNTAPGAQGTCQFLGGVFGGIYSTSSGSTLRWWDAISCPQNQLATIGLTFTSGQWNHLQIKGARSTCAYQALVNGTLVSSWTGTCAATGGYFALFGSNHVAGSPADIAWSNLVISKGTQVGCVP